MSVRITISSWVMHVIVVTLVGIAVPILGRSMGGCRCNGTSIAEVFVMIEIVLLLRRASPSTKASSLEASSRLHSSLEASSSSIVAAIEVVEIRSSSYVADEVASTSTSIPWVVWAVLPEVCAMMSPTRLVALLILSFLFGLFNSLCFNLGSLLVIILFVSHFLLLLHEVFDFLF